MPVFSAFGRSDVARCWAGFASLGAGLVHFAVVHEHLAEWWLFGAFFIGIGVIQVGWAVLALARDRAPLPRVVAAVNAGVIVLWVVTRTVGLPVGPERWTPEAVGVADVVCAALEAVVVVVLLAAVRVPRDARPPHLAAGATARAAGHRCAGDGRRHHPGSRRDGGGRARPPARRARDQPARGALALEPGLRGQLGRAVRVEQDGGDQQPGLPATG